VLSLKRRAADLGATSKNSSSSRKSTKLAAITSANSSSIPASSPAAAPATAASRFAATGTTVTASTTGDEQLSAAERRSQVRCYCCLFRYSSVLVVVRYDSVIGADIHKAECMLFLTLADVGNSIILIGHSCACYSLVTHLSL
jgi:hypothetical protein